MTTTMVALTIHQTWNGRPLPKGEQAFVELREDGDGLEVFVDAPFHGDPPPPAAPGSLEGLWNYEVVELFIASAQDGRLVRYTEVELSPHGHYLLLRLEGIRRPVKLNLPLEFQARIAGDRWQGHASLSQEVLPPKPWTANAYALHGQPPHRQHQAHAAVPGPKPDFHQPACFVPLPF